MKYIVLGLFCVTAAWSQECSHKLAQPIASGSNTAVMVFRNGVLLGSPWDYSRADRTVTIRTWKATDLLSFVYWRTLASGVQSPVREDTTCSCPTTVCGVPSPGGSSELVVGHGLIGQGTNNQPLQIDPSVGLVVRLTAGESYDFEGATIQPGKCTQLRTLNSSGITPADVIAAGNPTVSAGVFVVPFAGPNSLQYQVCNMSDSPQTMANRQFTFFILQSL